MRPYKDLYSTEIGVLSTLTSSCIVNIVGDARGDNRKQSGEIEWENMWPKVVPVLYEFNSITLYTMS